MQTSNTYAFDVTLWSSLLVDLPIFCTNALNEQKYYTDSEDHTAAHTMPPLFIYLL